MRENMCAYDPNRVCDKACAGFDKDALGLDSTPFWDASDPIPQFKWKHNILFKGSFCLRMGRHFGKKTVIEEK